MYHRQSIRLPEYEYASYGVYFVTLLTQNRKHLFGEIKNKQMILSKAGRVVFDYMVGRASTSVYGTAITMSALSEISMNWQ